MHKKQLQILIAIAVLLILAACGRNNEPELPYIPTYIYTNEEEIYITDYPPEMEPVVYHEPEPPAAPLPPPLGSVTVRPNQIGRASFSAGRQRIPAWLAIGKELQMLYGENTETNVQAWYARAKYYDLPPLCDLWIIPGFIDHDLSYYVWDVAHAFVTHLTQIGELDNLLRLYISNDENDLWVADRLRSNLWASFAGGQPVVHDRIYNYYFGATLTGIGLHFTTAAKFSVLTQNMHHFFTPCVSRESADFYIEVAEEALIFVGDFVGHHHHRRILSVYSHHCLADGTFLDDEGWGGGWFIQPRTAVTFLPSFHPPVVVTHEIAHALLHLAPHRPRSNFPSPRIRIGQGSYILMDIFEEALCIVIEKLFNEQTQNQRFAAEVAQHFARFQHIPDTPEGERAPSGAFIEFLHNEARASLRGERMSHTDAVLYHEQNQRGNPNATIVGEIRYPELHYYHAAASFMLYLMQHRGTMDDFWRIYANVHLMEEVYGYNMSDMIVQWTEFLGI